MENVLAAENPSCKIVKGIGSKEVHMLLAAISTMGEMSFAQVKKECGGEGWVPLVIYRFEYEANGAKETCPKHGDYLAVPI